MQLVGWPPVEVDEELELDELEELLELDELLELELLELELLDELEEDEELAPVVPDELEAEALTDAVLVDDPVDAPLEAGEPVEVDTVDAPPTPLPPKPDDVLPGPEAREPPPLPPLPLVDVDDAFRLVVEPELVPVPTPLVRRLPSAPTAQALAPTEPPTTRDSTITPRRPCAAPRRDKSKGTIALRSPRTPRLVQHDGRRDRGKVPQRRRTCRFRRNASAARDEVRRVVTMRSIAL